MKKFLPTLLALLVSATVFAQTDLIISEYVEGWSTNKAIEIYNPTTNDINIGAYRLTRYAVHSSGVADIPPAASQWTIALPDFDLEPFRSYVMVLDKRDPNGTGQEAPVWEQLSDRADVFLCPNYDVSNTLYHNGNDAIALEKLDGTLVDLFGRWGAPIPAAAAIPGSTNKVECWTNTSPYFTGEGVGITADHTMIRKSNVVNGVKANPTPFNPLAEYDTLSANSFYMLGWHKCDAAPNNATPVFEKNEYEFKVWKQAQNGKVLGTIKATDAENNALRYYINANNFIYQDNGDNDVRHTPFKLDKTTREFSLIAAHALQYSQWDTLFIKVSVNDGFSETDWITVKTILTDTDTGNETIKASDDFSVYPNPVSGERLTITAADAFNAVKVVNLAGQTIINERITAAKQHQIDLVDAQPGIYFVEINFDNQKNLTKRIVVQ